MCELKEIKYLYSKGEQTVRQFTCLCSFEYQVQPHAAWRVELLCWLKPTYFSSVLLFLTFSPSLCWFAVNCVWWFTDIRTTLSKWKANMHAQHASSVCVWRITHTLAVHTQPGRGVPVVQIQHFNIYTFTISWINKQPKTSCQVSNKPEFVSMYSFFPSSFSCSSSSSSSLSSASYFSLSSSCSYFSRHQPHINA